MTILTSCPGKYGDVLWAMPTCRTLAEHFGAPIDLVLSARYGDPSFCTLLAAQPYLNRVWADPLWQIEERGSAPTNPWHFTPEGDWDRVIHLGYQRWPQNVLPTETYLSAVSQLGHTLPPLDLTKPWSSVEPLPCPRSIAVGFTDEHFELKFGLAQLLSTTFVRQEEDDDLPQDNGKYALWPSARQDSRWHREGGCRSCDWLEAEKVISSCQAFLGDCAALHVLAVALGKPCVIMEPSEARWNPIFWPLGMDGLQVTCVKGHDGRPTFDARAVRHAIEEVLRREACAK